MTIARILCEIRAITFSFLVVVLFAITKLFTLGESFV